MFVLTALILFSSLLYAQQDQVGYKDIFFRPNQPTTPTGDLEIKEIPVRKKEAHLLENPLRIQYGLDLTEEKNEIKTGAIKLTAGLTGAYTFGKLRDFAPGHRTLRILNATGLSSKRKSTTIDVIGRASKYAKFPQLISKYYIIDGYLQTAVALRGKRVTDHPAITFTLQTANECRVLYELTGSEDLEELESANLELDQEGEIKDFLTEEQNPSVLIEPVPSLLSQNKCNYNVELLQINEINLESRFLNSKLKKLEDEDLTPVQSR
jgi:hypothetical protein